MSHRTCEISDCTNKLLARGLCSKHYRQDLIANRELCSIEGCPNRIKARKWCNKHYRRWQRNGDPEKAKFDRAASPEESFFARTQHDGDCILWTGSKNPDGYGKIRVHNSTQYAHRYAWERVNGPIPGGMQIDHACWNPSCVNVEHLRLATNAQNSSSLTSAKRNSSTGIRNVYKNGKGWLVGITKNGHRHYLGTYHDIDEAAEAAEQAREKFFGKFAGRG